MKGAIKSLISAKGFGFITPQGEEGGKKDVFFHTTGLNGVQFMDLQVGDMVTFEIEDSPKGARATNVTLVPQKDQA